MPILLLVSGPVICFSAYSYAGKKVLYSVLLERQGAQRKLVASTSLCLPRSRPTLSLPRHQDIPNVCIYTTWFMSGSSGTSVEGRGSSWSIWAPFCGHLCVFKPDGFSYASPNCSESCIVGVLKGVELSPEAPRRSKLGPDLLLKSLPVNGSYIKSKRRTILLYYTSSLIRNLKEERSKRKMRCSPSRWSNCHLFHT